MRFQILFLLVVVFCGARSQENPALRTSDSLTLRMLVFPARMNEFLQPPFLEPRTRADSEAAKIRRGAFLRNQILSLPSTVDDGLDLASSLRLESRVDNRYQFLRTALNAFLVGGEAYMVYRALKKYRYIH